MEFKGTKGRWYAGISNDVKQEETKKVIADCCFFGQDRNIEKANALLISKAPEMLDFINRISGEMLRNDFVLDERWYDQARELIKSATET